MKKIFKSLLVLLVAAFAFTACGNSDDLNNAEEGKAETKTEEKADKKDGEKAYVGIEMPTKSSQRWIDDGNNLVKQLEELGYKTDLQYGEDKVENQVAQIENMITKGVDYLVIASIDGSALTDVLQKAADAGIKVIAYDRLLMNSENVDYYVTFDNFKVGTLTAQYIVDKLGLSDGEKGPFNMEIFSGSPDDNNALINYQGYMEVLNPYLENGSLKVLSGQTEFNQTATLRWDGSTAQSRMDNLLSAYYTDEVIDAVLSPIDAISLGCISSLKGVGYGTAEKPLPVITGQDANIAGVQSIINGEQTMTIFKDTRLLSDATTKIIEALENGEEPEVNDTETYDNGVKVVPSNLSEPIAVDKDNYKEKLIDSGYYTEEELK